MYRHSVFGDASCNSYNVDLLECVISNQMPRHLSCKTYKRHTVIVCRGKTGYQVRRSGSACYKADPDLAR